MEGDAAHRGDGHGGLNTRRVREGGAGGAPHPPGFDAKAAVRRERHMKERVEAFLESRPLELLHGGAQGHVRHPGASYP
ncbi:hypothetical protein GCM10012319_06860 [Comamonas sp. KCTC 72670]|nr:hypothetical protein GCM10012319_06860 [Comamonas sp. KCTC 72670]